MTAFADDLQAMVWQMAARWSDGALAWSWKEGLCLLLKNFQVSFQSVNEERAEDTRLLNSTYDKIREGIRGIGATFALLTDPTW